MAMRQFIKKLLDSYFLSFLYTLFCCVSFVMLYVVLDAIYLYIDNYRCIRDE